MCRASDVGMMVVGVVVDGSCEASRPAHRRHAGLCNRGRRTGDVDGGRRKLQVRHVMMVMMGGI